MDEPENHSHDDESKDWESIVRQRLEEFRAVHRFLDDNRHRIYLPYVFLIRRAGKRVINRQDDEDSQAVGQKGLSAPPPTAAWAGILKQARHEMILAMQRYCPELLPELLGPGANDLEGRGR